MRLKIILLTTLFISCFSWYSYGQILNITGNNTILSGAEISNLSWTISHIEENQKNIQIDMDILKEVYSVNTARLNTTFSRIMSAITALGVIFSVVFGILAFFWWKDVSRLKDKFNDELNNLSIKSKEIEDKYIEIKTSEGSRESQLTAFLKENKEQENKIRTLELKEKMNSFLSKRRYEAALEYAILLENMNPEDLDIKWDKWFIYFRTGKYEDAIKGYETVLGKKTNDVDFILDILELYLISWNITKYTNLLKEKWSLLEWDKYREHLKYFKIIKAYKEGNTDNLINEISNSIKDYNETTKKNRLLDWSFTEIKTLLSKDDNSDKKIIMENFVNYISWSTDKKQFLESINKFRPTW